MRGAMIPSAVARLLVERARARASQMGVPVAVAIADAEGGLQEFSRMHRTLPISTELAIGKAFTAASIRIGTAELGRLAQPGAALYGIESTHPGKVVLFGGGLPLRFQGEVVGGIGVSGGSVEEDVEVAQHALEALERMSRWAEMFRPHFGQRRASAAALERIPDELCRALEESGAQLAAEDREELAGALALALW